MGLQNGVEKITKMMMVCLLFLMVVLAINSVRMEGGRPGLEFYLKPDFGKIQEVGVGKVVFAALGQSFFTLSIGIGAMAIFGSYIDKERSLTGEAINVLVLDTLVAFMAGLIIFPACAAYGIEAGQGPSLIFITLPNVFNHMAGGRFWGTLFFIFMTFAAASTVTAVFQNIVSFATDLTGCSIKKAVASIWWWLRSCRFRACWVSISGVVSCRSERAATCWISRISSSATTCFHSEASFT